MVHFTHSSLGAPIVMYRMMPPQPINLYGTYAITSDSTFTEHIVKHSGNAQMDNTESELRYKFVPNSENNAVYMMWKNTAVDQWIPELWERVILHKRKEEQQAL